MPSASTDTPPRGYPNQGSRQGVAGKREYIEDIREEMRVGRIIFENSK